MVQLAKGLPCGHWSGNQIFLRSVTICSDPCHQRWSWLEFDQPLWLSSNQFPPFQPTNSWRLSAMKSGSLWALILNDVIMHSFGFSAFSELTSTFDTASVPGRVAFFVLYTQGKGSHHKEICFWGDKIQRGVSPNPKFLEFWDEIIYFIIFTKLWTAVAQLAKGYHLVSGSDSCGQTARWYLNPHTW